MAIGFFLDYKIQILQQTTILPTVYASVLKEPTMKYVLFTIGNKKILLVAGLYPHPLLVAPPTFEPIKSEIEKYINNPRL